jgi:hypothetical protein
MTSNEVHGDRNRAGRLRHTWRSGALATGLVALGLSAAACSNGSSGPQVASVGSSASAGPSSSQNGTKPSTLAYAQCMQAHGIKNFPEPNSSGQLQLANGQSLPDFSSPQFQTAAETCRSLNPAGVAVSPAQQAQYLAANVKYAGCMRSHGVKNFPDPGSNGNFDLQNIDVNSPQVTAANKICATTPGTGIFSGRTSAGS